VNLCIQMRTRVAVLIIVIVTVIVLGRAGGGLPDAIIAVVLGAGLTGSAVARSLVLGTAPRRYR
jgi:hypothetical protein